MEDGEKKQKSTVKTDNSDISSEKYIHVSDIPIQKLDEDEDFQDNKDKVRSNQINSSLKETQPEANKNNETMGIP